jgi:G3E family GTPase
MMIGAFDGRCAHSSINPTAIFKRTHKSVIDIKNIFEIGSYSVAPTLDASQLADKFFEDGSDVDAGREVGAGARERIGKLQDMHEGHDHDHDHKTESKHLLGITSLVIQLPDLLPQSALDKLESFLQSIHWDSKFPGDPPRARPTEIVDKADEVESTEGFEILRSKGIFSFGPASQGDDIGASGTVSEVHVLQGVRDIFELTRLKGDTARTSTRIEDETDTRPKGGKLVLIGKRLGERDVWERQLFDALGV